MMQIKCRNLGRYEFSSNFIYDEHTQDEYEINYIIAGRCIMNIEGKNVVFRQGECALILPDTEHNFMVDGAQKCEIAQFEFSILERDSILDDLQIFVNPRLYYKIARCTKILEGIHNLYEYANGEQDESHTNALFNIEVQKLFLILSMQIEHEKKRQQDWDNGTLEGACAYIDTHYEQSISLEKLAKDNNVSSRYLRKLFMEGIGFSATEYITVLRMEKAKDLLKNTKDGVAEISAQVGYSTQQYFSMMFKKKIGISPKEFRNQFAIKEWADSSAEGVVKWKSIS